MCIGVKLDRQEVYKFLSGSMERLSVIFFTFKFQLDFDVVCICLDLYDKVYIRLVVLGVISDDSGEGLSEDNYIADFNRKIRVV